MDYRTRIRLIAEERKIKCLLHFTQTVNLPGIVAHGLLPRRELRKPSYQAYVSDKYRLDDDDGAVSVSISRISPLFQSKQHKSRHDDWLVLVLAPEILWTHECRFCWCNAARNEIRNHRGRRDGPWAFEKMFDRPDHVTRGLSPDLPTDSEAEVQILDPVAPSCILGVAVRHQRMVEPVREVLSQIEGGSPAVVVYEF